MAAYGEPLPQGIKETETEVYRKGNVVITRYIAGYAYPRNGNVHNPTPRYVYLRYDDGRRTDVADMLRKLKY